MINKAAALIRNARHTVVLTGAGISTPSGIPDFRSPGSGLWSNADPHVVASMFGFRQHPEAFFEWIRPVADVLLKAQPNPAHEALARLERLGHVQAIITQNIDMQHTRAGSQTVHEVHGSMAKGTCCTCYTTYAMTDFVDDFIRTGEIPRCPQDGGMIKPDVVLFGEALPYQQLDAALRAARTCDLMIVAGSSLEVAPVSNMPEVALAHGARLIVVNFEQTYIDHRADVVLHTDVARILPFIVDMVEDKVHDSD
ncbi:MAG: NAD-dependent deacetylase [Anaerolineae bacterium]